MKNLTIVYFDGYDEVRDLNNHNVIFSTKIPKEIEKYFERTTIQPSVIDNVINIWNKNGLVSVDEYLLNEGECTQEERELIVESLFNYYQTKTN